MASKSARAESSFGDRLVKQFVFAIILLPIVFKVWPDVIPFKAFQFWSVHGTPADWFNSLWPIFVWGTGFTGLLFILQNGGRFSVIRDPEEELLGGLLISLRAGVLEELLFRWLFFLSSIVMVKVMNWLFLGFMGLNPLRWFFLHVTGWLANVTTFHQLAPYLVDPKTWAIGAGMLAANAFFRSGHRYLGPIGVLNSWFLGMVFFWTTLHYGLLIAMLMHFLYDFGIFATIYVCTKLKEHGS